MKYNNRSIRDVIDDMRKLGLSLMYFYGHKKPISIWYGKPDDKCCEISYSRWKHINGRDVCRKIHCYIPEEYRIQELDKYGSDGEYVLPERVFNLLLACFHFNYGRSISDPYYRNVDMMELCE